MPAELADPSAQFAILFAALLLDAAIGDPDWLWRRVSHPVVWMGALIDLLDKAWNREGATASVRRMTGIAATALLVLLAVACGAVIEALVATLPFGWIGTAIVGSIFLAGRSLYGHILDVRVKLRAGLVGARIAVGRLVGRDTDGLDEAGVSRAAIESGAENLSDGLVAPAFWFALLGLPGLLAYKIVNTADSMIGHLSERHRDFGWAAARLDDLLNWPAARLTALLIALAAPIAGGSPSASFRAARADAGKHASPNAGWPEAAMAGALGIALGGPRSYGGEEDPAPALNAGGRAPVAGDIDRALRIGVGAFGVLLIVVGALAVLF